jgi:cytidylate kinase
LIPNIERRLSAWINVQERAGRAPSRQPHLTITISRQFGCEGYPLAESLKASLDERTGEPWTIFDKAIIERVSRETHLSERLLSNIGDESQVLDKFATLIPGWRTHSERYGELARHIVRIAQEGNAIIVGRGGAVVVQSLPNCFHFRLEAPLEHRVQSIQQRLGLGRDEAEALVVENQQSRERFIESFLHCSMADTRYYNAVFNTAKSSVERITRSMLELIPIPLERAQGKTSQ